MHRVSHATSKCSCAALSECLGDLPMLQHISLVEVGMGPTGAAAFSSALHHLPNLSSLNLRHNCHLAAAGAGSLAGALRTTGVTRAAVQTMSLDLGHTCPSYQGALALIGAAGINCVCTNKRLHSLAIFLLLSSILLIYRIPLLCMPDCRFNSSRKHGWQGVGHRTAGINRREAIWFRAHSSRTIRPSVARYNLLMWQPDWDARDHCNCRGTQYA